VARNRDRPGLHRVLELSMPSALTHLLPSVSFNHFNRVSHLHEHSFDFVSRLLISVMAWSGSKIGCSTN
jgi:hypothetical protein